MLVVKVRVSSLCFVSRYKAGLITVTKSAKAIAVALFVTRKSVGVGIELVVGYICSQCPYGMLEAGT